VVTRGWVGVRVESLLDADGTPRLTPQVFRGPQGAIAAAVAQPARCLCARPLHGSELGAPGLTSAKARVWVEGTASNRAPQVLRRNRLKGAQDALRGGEKRDHGEGDGERRQAGDTPSAPNGLLPPLGLAGAWSARDSDDLSTTCWC
jgi:hypothetical protein